MAVDTKEIAADRYEAVDRYFSKLFAPHDAVLEGALTASTAAGLPEIQVSPTQGQLLHMLVALQGAKRILEIGTLGGYSAIWMARALPADGRLISLEFDAKHAEVARKNVERAGLSDKVEIRVGAALSLLPGIAAEKLGSFDLVFIDADKENNPGYLDWALRLTRRGSLILIDNVVRSGTVLDAATEDASVKGTRRALEMMASDARLRSTALQLVGTKGWDGIAISLVTADA
jgi:predicted O-methyltransferase YrrM